MEKPMMALKDHKEILDSTSLTEEARSQKEDQVIAQ